MNHFKFIENQYIYGISVHGKTKYTKSNEMKTKNFAIDSITCNLGDVRGPLHVIDSNTFVTIQFQIKYPEQTNIYFVSTKSILFTFFFSIK